MSAAPTHPDAPPLQSAIYRVALSLDALLVNGIPFGVQNQDRAVRDGFLEMVAGNLRRDVTDLEAEARASGSPERPEFAELKACCGRLIGAVSGLRDFRSLPLSEVRSAVGQVLAARQECVRRLEELEVYFRVPRPFYPSRPAHSTALVERFLADLEQTFAAEWAAGSGK